MDATELLTQQHDEAKGLFEQFRGSEDPDERGRIARDAVLALRAHTAIEEELFYPAIREARESLGDEVLEGLEEHHVVEVLLDELEGLPPDHEHFAAKFTVISEMVEHHVEEEEQEMFPEVREALGEERLRSLGQQMQDRHDELTSENVIDLTKEELYQRARELDIDGRSSMSKRQLANAVRSSGEG